MERARRKARQGKAARSAKHAIAIGLSKARRAGVPLAGKGRHVSIGVAPGALPAGERPPGTSRSQGRTQG